MIEAILAFALAQGPGERIYCSQWPAECAAEQKPWPIRIRDRKLLRHCGDSAQTYAICEQMRSDSMMIDKAKRWPDEKLAAEERWLRLRQLKEAEKALAREVRR